MGVILYLDTILVPLSLFLTVSYHVFLWHSSKNNPNHTTIGINTLKRRAWLEEFNQGDEKKGMMAVQSLRNTLMETILTATVSIVLTIILAALANNAYKASNVLDTSKLLGSQTGGIIVLKFGSAALSLSVSFLCRSMALGYLIDANFLINATACGGDDDDCGLDNFSDEHTGRIVERGFMLATVGNRVFFMTLPILVWMMFGPAAVLFSSLALVWAL